MKVLLRFRGRTRIRLLCGFAALVLIGLASLSFPRSREQPIGLSVIPAEHDFQDRSPPRGRTYLCRGRQASLVLLKGGSFEYHGESPWKSVRGDYSERAGEIHLRPPLPLGYHSFAEGGTLRLIPVRWGDQVYLVPGEDGPHEFAEHLACSWHTSNRDWLKEYFIAETDVARHRYGRPTLPSAEYRYIERRRADWATPLRLLSDPLP